MSELRQHAINRRSALVGLGAGSLGASLIGVQPKASAQDMPTEGHILVGTWVVKPIVGDPAVFPSVAVFSSDGAFWDANAGISGLWQPTDANRVDHCFVGIISSPDFNGYIVVRGPIVIDASGNSWSQDYNAMTVAADGTVVNTSPTATAHATRLPLVIGDALGTALQEVPTWTPAATPTA